MNARASGGGEREPALRGGGALAAAAAAAVSLAPWAGTFAVLGRAWFGRRRAGGAGRGLGRGAGVGVVPFVPLLAVLAVAAAGGRADLGLLVAALLATALASASPLPRAAVRFGAGVAVAVLLVVLAFEVGVSRATFLDRQAGGADVVARALALAAGSQRLAGPEDAAAAPAVHVRAWRVAPEAVVELAFEARLLGAADALRWGTAGSAGGRVRWAPEPLALDGAWRDVALRVAPGERASPEVLAFALEVPPGAAVEVRRVRATDAGGVRVAAMAAPARPRAWYGWPNLAGHVVVATAAAALATARRRVDGGAVALVAAAAVLLTGSRTALAALVVVVAWWAWLAAAPRARVWWAVGGAVLAAVAFGPASGLLGRAGVWTLDDRNVVSRLDQARAAWDALAASPWTGAALPESAHNLWLDLAGGYGVPGLAAAAWLTVGLLVVARRRAGAPALGAVVGVLTLQLADVSLFFLGVSGPVLLAVAALGDERRAAAGVGEGTGAGVAEGAAGRSIEGAGVP